MTGKTVRVSMATNKLTVLRKCSFSLLLTKRERVVFRTLSAFDVL